MNRSGKASLKMPIVDNNWKITGIDLSSSFKEDVFEMLRSRVLAIPASEDGRTLNVKVLNIYEMIDEGFLKMMIYVVEPGDNLWAIAQKYGLTWEELNTLNDWKIRNFSARE